MMGGGRRPFPPRRLLAQTARDAPGILAHDGPGPGESPAIAAPPEKAAARQE
jgi:hypothetical protein